MGLDVGDRKTHYCVLGLGGELVVEGAVATRKASLRVQFEGKVKMRIALEAGAHAQWISPLLAEMGHEVIAANPRNLRMISESDSRMIRQMRGCWPVWRTRSTKQDRRPV